MFDNFLDPIKLYLSTEVWFFTSVYTSPTYTIRLDLWHHLTSLRDTIKAPWMLVGDFNEITLPSELKGGNFDHNRAVNFLNMIDSCNFLDVTTIGGLFTWCRNCVGKKKVFRKLDRGLFDMLWRLNFPEAYVEVL